MNTSREPEKLAQEIREIRRDMTDVVIELDRRRHEVLDWRLQLKNHAGLLLIAAAGLLLVAGGTVGASIFLGRRRQRPLERARRFQRAFSRIIAHPELVAQPRPNIAKKALGAVVGAAAGSLAKTVVSRITQPALASPNQSRSTALPAP